MSTLRKTWFCLKVHDSRTNPAKRIGRHLNLLFTPLSSIFKPFLHRWVTNDEKWATYKNIAHIKDYCQPGFYKRANVPKQQTCAVQLVGNVRVKKVHFELYHKDKG